MAHSHSRSKALHHDPAPLRPAVRKQAEDLLNAFVSPNQQAYQAAKDLLNSIVVEPTVTTVSPSQVLLILLSLALSGRTLPGYSTLDYDHVCEIQLVLDAIKRYQADGSQKRPLNFLMLASPGAGKSHFIQCIAAKLGTGKVGPVTFNMVALERHEDLIPSLDAARNVKVEDRLPLLFLDEFDAHKDKLALLLPLLWDGHLTLGQHSLKLGKVVIVLAGSDPHLPEMMEEARSMKGGPPAFEPDRSKMVDLLSRINGGVIRIPLLSDPVHSSNRRADKVCIAVELLRQRFGDKLETIPLALLRFISSTEFRYGIRSIAHLVGLIPQTRKPTELKLSSLKLPLDAASRLRSSSLAYHLVHEDQAPGIVQSWKEATRTAGQVTVSNETLNYYSHRFEEALSTLKVWFIDRLWSELSKAATPTTK